MIKIVANYLPQFHRIPENDKWWGEGFTDWVAVKKAKPLFEGHIQPKIPLDGYYDLSEYGAIKNQVDLANQYGVYGFAIYHYWFNNDLMLLQKPAEVLLRNPELKTHFLFLWDNQSWKRTWSQVKAGNDWAPGFDEASTSGSDGVLAKLEYGEEEDWENHFKYLLPFFCDERYIKIDNKPVFGFFNSCVKEEAEVLRRMRNYWNKLAIDEGFSGGLCIGKESHWKNTFEDKFLYSPFVNNRIRNALIHKIKDKFMINTKGIRIYDYDECWKETINNARLSDSHTILSGFVNFDDSPRRGIKGRIINGSTPAKFERNMMELMKIAKKQGKEYIFLTAWNEWGEGAYLEPDATNGYAYLEALKRAIDTCSE